MKIAIFGLGYVGAINATCLALMGHEIWAIDKDSVKIRWMQDGIAPINEPGFGVALKDALETGRLYVSSAASNAVAATELAMICVGTPTPKGEGTYLGFVESVVREIHKSLSDNPHPYTVVLRSTVPPGTMETLVLPVLNGGNRPNLDSEVRVCFNPEFLREGTAIDDFANPPFTVVGTLDTPQERELVVAQMAQLYKTVTAPIVGMNYREAELLKLFCNVFHALKISFANEIGTLAAYLGADSRQLMETFVLDTKLNISRAYLRPGFAFGGSCLPKDLRSLVQVAHRIGLSLPLCEAIMPSNEEHLGRAVSAVLSQSGTTIGLMGLVFKPGTDDLRESPALQLAKHLLAANRRVLIYEPEIQVDRLVGANLDFVQEHLPNYRDCLVEWEFLRSHVDLFVVTRAGLLTSSMRSAIHMPVVDVSNIGDIVKS